MNRLVLIGNGFDLAHDLKTRYEDFIYKYWERRFYSFIGNGSNVSKDILCTLTSMAPWSVVYHNNSYYFGNSNGKELYNYLKDNPNKFQINYTPFFESIHHSIETKGWVDIEKEYYDLLEQNSFANYSAKNIEELNNQLLYLQKQLTEYLTEINKQPIQVNDGIRKKIYAPIELSDIAVEATQTLNNYIEWCNKQEEDYWKYVLNNYNINSIGSGLFFEVIDYKKDPLNYSVPKAYMLPQKIMLLNFNYTKTAEKYLNQNSNIFSLNHIHGVLEDPESIIFGYGDEFEDKYKKLQNLNNNECLKNIKTIRYLESDNYRKMHEFVESAPFQVIIMGHSCGNSDRTLLNTIFEHKNCVSIKPYYHKIDDNNNKYIELIQNISRNFTDMKLMRDRVVNKTYCEPLLK